MTEDQNDPKKRERDPKREDGPAGPLGRRASMGAAWIVVALLLLISLNYLASGQRGEEISYSELKAKIAAGEVQKVTVGETRICFHLIFATMLAAFNLALVSSGCSTRNAVMGVGLPGGVMQGYPSLGNSAMSLSHIGLA